MIKWLIILHVLGATIWIGGHLLLSLRYLPTSLRMKDPLIIATYEKKYEAIGFPALLIQLITGIWMAISYYHVSLFGFTTAVEKTITLKLILLIITILLALNVRFFIFPKLSSKNLWWLAAHIITVTLISVLMLYLGVSIRFGGI